MIRLNFMIFLICFFCVGASLYAEEQYYNPIDKKTYTADWKTYQPSNKTTDNIATRVVNKGVRLLNTQEEFDSNITVKNLSNFIISVQNVISKVIEPKKDFGLLLVEIQISPKEPPIYKLANQGDIKKDTLQEIYDNLMNLNQIRSEKSSIKFQVTFAIQKDEINK